MNVFRLSHQAEEDLNEIADYIANSNPPCGGRCD